MFIKFQENPWITSEIIQESLGPVFFLGGGSPCINSYVSKALARRLYFAFIYSRISYGIEVYGNNYKHSVTQIQTIQNKLLKLILNMDRMTSTNTLHSNLRILKVSDISKVKILLFVNNCLLGSCPYIFISYFTSHRPGYSLRSSGLNVPRTRTVVGSLGVYCNGARLWNGLSEDINKFRHQKNKKTHLVKHFIASY